MLDKFKELLLKNIDPIVDNIAVTMQEMVIADSLFYTRTGDEKGNIVYVPNSINIRTFTLLTESIEGLITKNEMQTLVNLCVYGPTNGNVIEIGSYKGRSAIFLAKGCEVRNEGIVYAIDPLISNNEEIIENIKEYKDRIKFIRKYSYEALASVPNNNIRLLFIDGDHEYEGVKKDIELYSPLLNKDGIIALHDFSLSGSGVVTAVMELIVGSQLYDNFVLSDSLFMARKK